MWNIDARKAVGPLALGMPVAIAVDVLGTKYHTFKRVPEAKNIIYAFNEDGVHLECHQGTINVISVFQPRELIYAGVQLLGRPIQQVADELNTNGISIERVDAGCWIDQAGVLLVDVNHVVDGVELYR